MAGDPRPGQMMRINWKNSQILAKHFLLKCRLRSFLRDRSENLKGEGKSINAKNIHHVRQEKLWYHIFPLFDPSVCNNMLSMSLFKWCLCTGSGCCCPRYHVK